VYPLSGRQHGVNKGCVDEVSEILIFSILNVNGYIMIPDTLMVKINRFVLT
jgi:hypothetical protein